jgi:hypothetical protein
VGELGPASGTHKRLVFPSSSSRIRQRNQDSLSDSLFSGAYSPRFYAQCPRIERRIGEEPRCALVNKRSGELAAPSLRSPCSAESISLPCIPGAAVQSEVVGKFWADAVDNVKARAGSRFKETDRSNN